MLVMLGLAPVPLTTFCQRLGALTKRLSCDASPSLLPFSSNSFSGGGLVEISTTRL